MINLHPIILPNGLIRVRVRPQITSVDFGNATLRKGRYVPAIVTRQIDATYDSCHTAA
jgi:Flp pilus assembly secretin CpaC